MMMNVDDASSCSSELLYVVAQGNQAPLPPTHSPFLPVLDQLASSDSMEVSVPAASNPAAHYINSNYGNDHGILQYYPASHYLASGNPYSHYFSRSTFLPTPQDQYYFPTLLDDNMASFGATQLGLNSLNYGGYGSYYLPPRGDYVYGRNPLRCQVDGCTADLSKAKRYHRRHRVCEQHSKAPVVITSTAIMPQRFCQQCSRFHEVDEFDDTKKSCRQRLADHNRRRRKPKPNSTDMPLKRMAHVKKLATAKDKGNSSTNMSTRFVLGIQELGSSSKEVNPGMGLEEVVIREPVDPKGKAY